MKAIVFLKDGTMHSAWWSIKEAKDQINVLSDNGYHGSYLKPIDHNYENGHYFI